MKTYLLCAAQGDGSFLCTNAFVWDEAQPFAPPAGAAVVVKAGPEWIGWSYAGGQWSAPVPEGGDDLAQG